MYQMFTNIYIFVVYIVGIFFINNNIFLIFFDVLELFDLLFFKQKI